MKGIVGAAILGLAVSFPGYAGAQCNTIKSGDIVARNGDPVALGYDQYGYNYQAHIFNGLYENYSRPAEPVMEGTEHLVMKWSDNWLANVDCNNDFKLDRGLDRKTGESTGVSQGWCTNHFEGDYEGSDADLHHYTYFVKIAYVGPAPSEGPDPFEETRIWGSYAIIEEVQTDDFGEYGGRIHFLNKLTGPGLGQF